MGHGAAACWGLGAGRGVAAGAAGSPPAAAARTSVTKRHRVATSTKPLRPAGAGSSMSAASAPLHGGREKAGATPSSCRAGQGGAESGELMQRRQGVVCADVQAALSRLLHATAGLFAAGGG